MNRYEQETNDKRAMNVENCVYLSNTPETALAEEGISSFPEVDLQKLSVIVTVTGWKDCFHSLPHRVVLRSNLRSRVHDQECSVIYASLTPDGHRRVHEMFVLTHCRMKLAEFLNLRGHRLIRTTGSSREAEL